MNIQDELTHAIAEAAKGVLGKSKKENLKDYKPTRGGSNQDDFIDLHAIDDKEDPEQKKQVEEKDVEEGNEFTKAAAKAKLAGEDEFEFDGKTYPVEIDQDAAEKILGKKESVELEEAVDNFFGFPTKDKLVKFQSMAKKLKIKPISNPTVLKRGGKEFHVMGFEGSVSDIEKAMKVAGDIIKEALEKKTEELEEAKGFPESSQGAKQTYDAVVRLSASLKKGSNLNKAVNKRLSGKYDSDFVKMEKAITTIFDTLEEIDREYQGFDESTELEEMFNRLKPDDVRDSYGTIKLKYRSSADIRDAEDKLKKAGINVRKSGDTLEVDSDSPAFKKAKITSTFDSSKREKAIMKVLGESVEESTDLEEAMKPADFVKGGDTKITKREVDGMLSKLFIDTKLAKAVEANSAFKAGEKSNGKKNPYKKDTADFHLYILGQQSAQSE
jgi:hypothetical protein